MEKFKVGDKVSFLNTQGGGIVRKIIDSRMAEVEIEEGFNIPVLMTDLVMDFRALHADMLKSDDDTKKDKEKEVQPKPIETQVESNSEKLHRFGKNAEHEGIYLAFVPHNQQWVLMGLLDVVIVNHTPADILYSLTLRQDDKYRNIDYGSIEPYSKKTIETISREDVEAWCEGTVQAILCQEESVCAYNPLQSPFSIRSSRFFKDGSYVSSGILGGKALMLNLSSIEALRVYDADMTRIQKEGIGGGATVGANGIVKETPAIDKHKTAPGEAVVDLHIGELVDNILGMSSGDMFKTQMDYFKKMLDSAIKAEYRKVTFIHGVGNGVLKNAIIDELKQYDNATHKMASVAKFGVGAIDVTLNF